MLPEHHLLQKHLSQYLTLEIKSAQTIMENSHSETFNTSSANKSSNNGGNCL